MVSPCASQLADLDAQRLDHQRRQPLRRLVEQQQSGLPISVRAMVSICCSPPDRNPPGGRAARAAPGTARRRVSIVQLPGPAAARPRHRGFPTRSARRRCGDPPARSRCRRARPGAAASRRCRWPFQTNRPARRRREAHHRAHRRRLADAVAARAGRRTRRLRTSSEMPNSTRLRP